MWMVVFKFHSTKSQPDRLQIASGFASWQDAMDCGDYLTDDGTDGIFWVSEVKRQ